MLEGSGSAPDEVRIVQVVPGQSDYISAAIALGDLARKTLGLLPYAVYHDSVGRGTLAVALCGERVVGYVLYRLPRNRVTLVHLCVHPDFSKRGIARRLVAYVSELHQEREGILAKCRRDYGIDQIWLKLKFVQQAEVPGRGKNKKPLVVWWLDHGHPTLLTQRTEPVLRAGFDLSVLRALFGDDPTEFRESQALIGDVYQQVELVVTPALRVDLSLEPSESLRKRYTDRLNTLPAVREGEIESAELMAELTQLLAADRSPGQMTWDDNSLVAGLADCVRAAVTVFVTFTRAGSFFDTVASRYGVRAMSPLDVILHLEELGRAQDYRPVALSGSQYHKVRLDQAMPADLRLFVDRDSGEDVNGLRSLISGIEGALRSRYAMIGPDGTPLFLYATDVKGATFNVPLLRVHDCPEAPTLARQMLFALREECRRSGKAVIQVTDPWPSRLIRQAALTEGFAVSDEGHLFALVIDVVGPTAAIQNRARELVRTLVREYVPSLRSDMPATSVAEFEKAWWPARLNDTALPSYTVSIKAKWSSQLFGVPPTLTDRPAELVLSREHVYYRSPPQLIQAPARVLWYVTKDTSSGAPYPPGIIGCSLVDASYVAGVDELVDSYRHLGVLGRDEIRSVAKNDQAQVIRFTHTEIFPTLVTLTRLQELARELGQQIIPQSPTRISAEAFARILTEGQVRHR